MIKLMNRNTVAKKGIKAVQHPENLPYPSLLKYVSYHQNCEVWKDVPVFRGKYQASTKGNIRSVNRWVFQTVNGRKYAMFRHGKNLRQTTNSSGYKTVTLRGEDRRRKHGYVTVQDIVAHTFIPNPKHLSDVNHKDESRTNNNLSNLEWISHKDNMNYGHRALRASLNDPMNKPTKLISRRTKKELYFRSAREASRFIKSHTDYKYSIKSLSQRLRKAVRGEYKSAENQILTVCGYTVATPLAEKLLQPKTVNM